jgi:hypothetical protein
MPAPQGERDLQYRATGVVDRGSILRPRSARQCHEKEDALPSIHNQPAMTFKCSDDACGILVMRPAGRSGTYARRCRVAFHLPSRADYGHASDRTFMGVRGSAGTHRAKSARHPALRAGRRTRLGLAACTLYERAKGFGVADSRSDKNGPHGRYCVAHSGRNATDKRTRPAHDRRVSPRVRHHDVAHRGDRLLQGRR